jgi:hypothetical protein
MKEVTENIISNTLFSAYLHGKNGEYSFNEWERSNGVSQALMKSIITEEYNGLTGKQAQAYKDISQHIVKCFDCIDALGKGKNLCSIHLSLVSKAVMP